MYKKIEKNLFEFGKNSNEFIVNTVNTEKVMGKGIALEFKSRFPEYYNWYKDGTTITNPGDVEISKHWNIISIATKNKWKYPSKIEWVEQCLKNLKKLAVENKIKNIYMPAPGAGNGKINFENEVEPLIKKYFNDDLVDVFVCSSNVDTLHDQKILEDIRMSLHKPYNSETFPLGLEIFWELREFCESNTLRLLRDIRKIKGIGEKKFRILVNFYEKNNSGSLIQTTLF